MDHLSMEGRHSRVVRVDAAHERMSEQVADRPANVWQERWHLQMNLMRRAANRVIRNSSQPCVQRWICVSPYTRSW